MQCDRIETGTPRRSSTSNPNVVDPTTDAASFDKIPTNGGVEKKTRKRTHTFDVGLAEATKDLMRGWEIAEKGKKKRHTFDVGLAEATNDLMRGWEIAEEGKKKRHEVTMDAQHSQHEGLVGIERQKVEISLIFANAVQAMTSTLGKMAADKL
ncbi:hypothetical protein GOP47_0026288 [Adiantum capillus-veneris]|nr:hypothetical protein GOP47_0026288 [Adiantum capillus-veneris]